MSGEPPDPTPSGTQGHASQGHGTQGHGTQGHDDEVEGDDALAAVRGGFAESALLSRLFGAMRVARMHALDNVSARQALDELHQELGRFLGAHDRVILLIGEGRRVFVNGRMTRARRTGGEWLEGLVDQLGRSGLAGLVLAGVWSLDAVRDLVGAFGATGGRAAAGPAERLAAVQSALAALPPPAHAVGLDLTAAAAASREEEEGYLSESQRAAFYFARLLALAEATWSAVAQGRPPDAMGRNVRQTLMKVVDALASSVVFEARLLAMTAVEPPDGHPDAAHAARVAALAMVLGRALGLERGQQADLGLAALHHDLGRIGAQRRVEDGGGESQDSVADHVARGVQVALRGRNYAASGLLRLAVALEHHRPVDGVPDDSWLAPPHPLSEVVAIADHFDRLEHGRPGVPPLGAAAALAQVEASGKHSPAALALLVETLGRHPRGSVLRLAAGEVVVVLADGARVGGRPLVRRVMLATGAPDAAQPIGRLSDRSVVAADLGPNVQLDWRTALLS